eukprot:TRINITY_DN15178_c0_g1_i1.p1 TRINITY_DN15178_c0_g1~~TRINITY_DN15178_c0_g1_i1.p1  ORF type:complete len:276 (+),score=40.92 TRINITY_DN15178_c0_g1_i1:44-871(+)
MLTANSRDAFEALRKDFQEKARRYSQAIESLPQFQSFRNNAGFQGLIGGSGIALLVTYALRSKRNPILGVIGATTLGLFTFIHTFQTQMDKKIGKFLNSDAPEAKQLLQLSNEMMEARRNLAERARTRLNINQPSTNMLYDKNQVLQPTSEVEPDTPPDEDMGYEDEPQTEEISSQDSISERRARLEERRRRLRESAERKDLSTPPRLRERDLPVRSDPVPTTFRRPEPTPTPTIGNTDAVPDNNRDSPAQSRSRLNEPRIRRNKYGDIIADEEY